MNGIGGNLEADNVCPMWVIYLNILTYKHIISLIYDKYIYIIQLLDQDHIQAISDILVVVSMLLLYPGALGHWVVVTVLNPEQVRDTLS
jgi:hypothetical protein